MGYVFNKEATENFDWWRRNAEGQKALRVECELIRRVLKPQIGDTILDVGCGPGFHLREFREWGLRPMGLDASEPMLELARQRLGKDVPVTRGFAEELPFPENYFDTVIFVTSLEFVSRPSTAIKEAVRVARKRIMVVILNAYSWGGIARHVEGLFRESAYREARLLNLWKLKRMVRRHLDFCSFHWGASRSVVLPGAQGKESFSVIPRIDSPFARFIALRIDLAATARQVEPALNRVILSKAPSWAGRSYRIRQ